MSETVVGHCQQDATNLYIGRHEDDVIRHARNTSIGECGWLGNPFVMESKAKPKHREQGDIEIVETRAVAVERFAQYLADRFDSDSTFRRALFERVRGETLGCWCQTVDADGPACHGEVIARTADAIKPKPGEA